MLINTIVDYCDRQCQDNHCSDCANENDCHRDCKSCLDDLHYHRNHLRSDYNCVKLLNYYVCRYSHKYCSEIIYVLESIDLSRYPYFHILSLGCGGAPDLMAFDFMHYSREVIYWGMDKNIFWEKVHHKIQNEYIDGHAIFFRGIDVLRYFEDHEARDCNVIIVSYLISFVYDQIGDDGVRSLFKQLADKVIKVKPTDSPLLIILNDVDSINTGRDSFNLLIPVLESRGIEINYICRKRFKEQSYFGQSTSYYSKANKFSIDDGLINDYKVAIRCESAQLIVEVK